MLFRTNDYITVHLREKGEWEPSLVRVSDLLLRGVEAPVVLDLGANLGAYCIPLGKILQRSGGCIFAYEPQRIVYYQLCGNIFLNRLDNIQAFHAALGDEAGEVDIPEVDYARNPNIGAFALAPEHRFASVAPSLSTQTYRVAMQRLDDLQTLRRVALVKMDVEGYERKVLRGGGDFLARNGYPPVIFEMWDTAAFANERQLLARDFAALGYSLVPLDSTNFIAQHPQGPVAVVAETNEGQRIIRRTR